MAVLGTSRESIVRKGKARDLVSYDKVMHEIRKVRQEKIRSGRVRRGEICKVR